MKRTSEQINQETAAQINLDWRIRQRQRIDAASNILLDNGWTQKELETMLDGLSPEDAVVYAERHAKAALEA